MRYFNVMILGPSQSPYEGDISTIVISCGSSISMWGGGTQLFDIVSSLDSLLFRVFESYVLQYGSTWAFPYIFLCLSIYNQFLFH